MNIVGHVFEGGCLAICETDREYDGLLRGERCTERGCGGLLIAPLPIALLLFSADEVAADEIDPAIRFRRTIK